MILAEVQIQRPPRCLPWCGSAGDRIADFNRDAVPDVVVANRYSASVTIFLGTGK
jgi:hypothetical protein